MRTPRVPIGLLLLILLSDLPIASPLLRRLTNALISRWSRYCAAKGQEFNKCSRMCVDTCEGYMVKEKARQYAVQRWSRFSIRKYFHRIQRHWCQRCFYGCRCPPGTVLEKRRGKCIRNHVCAQRVGALINGFPLTAPIWKPQPPALPNSAPPPIPKPQPYVPPPLPQVSPYRPVLPPQKPTGSRLPPPIGPRPQPSPKTGGMGVNTPAAKRRLDPMCDERDEL